MQPFIYALLDPAEPKHVRYVGMAVRNASRPYQHAKNAHKESAQRFYLYNWIRKIQLEGREPDVMILEQLPEHASGAFVGFIEKCYIKSLRSIGHRLTNTAEGGAGGKTISSEAMSVVTKKMWETHSELRKQARLRALAQIEIEDSKFGFKKGQGGWSGRCHSEESKQQMRESSALRWTPEAREKARMTILASDEANPERRRKIKEARAKQIISHSEETRHKIGAAWTDERRTSNPLKGRPRSQEVRDRISQARKGWKMPEETRAKLREIALQRTRKRLSNGRFGKEEE